MQKRARLKELKAAAALRYNLVAATWQLNAQTHGCLLQIACNWAETVPVWLYV